MLTMSQRASSSLTAIVSSNTICVVLANLEYLGLVLIRIYTHAYRHRHPLYKIVAVYFQSDICLIVDINTSNINSLTTYSLTGYSVPQKLESIFIICVHIVSAVWLLYFFFISIGQTYEYLVTTISTNNSYATERSITNFKTYSYIPYFVSRIL